MKDKIPMESVIDIQVLENIQEQFSKVTGFAAVTVDSTGNPITKESNFTSFCNKVREDEEMRKVCYQCDAHGGLQAALTGKPFIYKCHCGLIDFAVPIMVMGKYIGAILSGQIMVEEDKYTEMNHIVQSNYDTKKTVELEKLKKEVNKVEYEKVLAGANLLYEMSSYLVEKQLINLVKDELSTQSMKLMEESKLRSELEKSLKESELKALQSQINPHFLFNVLNTIGRLALKEGAEETEEIVYALSEMMRYTLKKNSTDLMPFKEEIKHIDNYLNIQQVRNRDRLNYKLNIAQDTYEVLCPFMIVQPLVENSINYVIEKKIEGGTIKVDAYIEKGHLHIIVEDDGDGISEEKIKRLLKNKESETNNSGVGIYNINKRLVNYFGEEYKLVIENKKKPNKGLKTMIKIPCNF